MSMLLGTVLGSANYRSPRQSLRTHAHNRLFPVDQVAKTDTVVSFLQSCPITDTDRTSNMPWGPPSVPPLGMYNIHLWLHVMKTLPWWAAIRLSLDSKVSEDMSEG